MTNQNVEIKKIGNRYFYTQNGLVLDKKCPDCGKFFINHALKCSCGHVDQSKKISSLASLRITLFVLTGLLIIFSLIGFHLFDLASKQLDFKSVSPLQVQVMTSIEDSKFKNYIKNVYVKEKKDNNLLILIKPYLWNTLSEKEKEQILNYVQKKWNKIYKNKNPDSRKIPAVKFANL